METKHELQTKLEKLHINEVHEFFYKLYGKSSIESVRNDCTTVTLRGLRHFWEWQAAPTEKYTDKEVQYLQTLADTNKFIEEDLKSHPVIAAQMRSHFQRKRELFADYQERISEKISPSTEDEEPNTSPSES